MKVIKLAIADYLSALAEAHGQGHASCTHVRHAGGSNFVIESSDGTRRIVDIGSLRLMSQRLKESAMRKRAA